MAGFKSPDHPENPELWTDKDRNASAAMLSVLSRMRRDNLSGRISTNPTTGDRGIPPTAAFVDEGNMVTADPAGRGYLTVNVRQGRSLNSVVFFMDQQARGMQAIEKQASAETAEVNQFATVLAFKQRSKGEARAALAALRSSDDDRLHRRGRRSGPQTAGRGGRRSAPHRGLRPAGPGLPGRRRHHRPNVPCAATRLADQPETQSGRLGPPGPGQPARTGRSTRRRCCGCGRTSPR